ncbi:50S ribosomal protein L24e [Candidatus Woesearchaeota archaeon]|nr:MAG: 50S ribosomal protein L24e [Candidatus Woesearchaeota archaeon]
MVKCTFCNEELAPGTGTMYVKNDGKIWYFCSRKCEVNKLKLKRNPRYARWSGLYEKKGNKGGNK